MTSTLIIISALILAFAFTIGSRIRKVKRFQKIAKPGDRCRYYIGEDKATGEIVHADINFYYIVDIFGNIALRSKTEIYPI